MAHEITCLCHACRNPSAAGGRCDLQWRDVACQANLRKAILREDKRRGTGKRVPQLPAGLLGKARESSAGEHSEPFERPPGQAPPRIDVRHFR
jgi:hypothetical protein